MVKPGGRLFAACLLACLLYATTLRLQVAMVDMSEGIYSLDVCKE